MAEDGIPQEFEVGTPVLVCRWRLSGGELPAAGRHLRALGKRTIAGAPLSKQLLGWVRQHIEWTLADGSREHPDGVLMLVIDAEGRAAMAAGDYEPLPDTSLAALAARAEQASREASETDVAPETLWVVRAGSVACGIAPGERSGGVTSLVFDLARTLGMPVSRETGLAEAVADGSVVPDEAFLASDEHGVVVASDAAGDVGRRFAEGWQTLFERAARSRFR